MVRTKDRSMGEKDEGEKEEQTEIGKEGKKEGRREEGRRLLYFLSFTSQFSPSQFYRAGGETHGV